MTAKTLTVAQDLTALADLAQQLDEQAEHLASAKVDGHGLPGGLAMVALAPVANTEAWRETFYARERGGRSIEHIADEEDEWEPPLQTLLFWSEQWRVEHGAETDQRPTIATETAFIRWALEWAWANELHFDDFAEDVRKARWRLENVLYAGDRPERTRITCDRHDDDEGPRLVKHYGAADDGSEDRWKCPACKHWFDAGQLNEAHAKQLRSKGAERWVHQVDAIGTLKAQGRAERTIRQWLFEGEGTGYCDPITHEVWVWWPDLWRRHVTTPMRKRAAA